MASLIGQTLLSRPSQSSQEVLVAGQRWQNRGPAGSLSGCHDLQSESVCREIRGLCDHPGRYCPSNFAGSYVQGVHGEAVSRPIFVGALGAVPVRGVRAAGPWWTEGICEGSYGAFFPDQRFYVNEAAALF